MSTLFESFLEFGNFFQAWQFVKKKNKAGGIDETSIPDYEKHLSDNLHKLIARIRQRAWVPQPYLETAIPKNKNEVRHIDHSILFTQAVQFIPDKEISH